MSSNSTNVLVQTKDTSRDETEVEHEPIELLRGEIYDRFQEGRSGSDVPLRL